LTKGGVNGTKNIGKESGALINIIRKKEIGPVKCFDKIINSDWIRVVEIWD
jgi:hypothetical protein